MIQFLVAHWIYFTPHVVLSHAFPCMYSELYDDKRMQKKFRTSTRLLQGGAGISFFLICTQVHTFATLYYYQPAVASLLSHNRAREQQKKKYITNVFPISFFSNYMSRRRTIRLGTDDSDKAHRSRIGWKKVFVFGGRKVFRKKTNIFCYLDTADNDGETSEFRYLTNI